MTDEQFEELQSNIADIDIFDIRDNLSCAASCETKEDLVENLENTITSVTELLQELKILRKESKTRGL